MSLSKKEGTAMNRGHRYLRGQAAEVHGLLGQALHQHLEGAAAHGRQDGPGVRPLPARPSGGHRSRPAAAEVHGHRPVQAEVPGDPAPYPRRAEIGRASCRERV